MLLSDVNEFNGIEINYIVKSFLTNVIRLSHNPYIVSDYALVTIDKVLSYGPDVNA